MNIIHVGVIALLSSCSEDQHQNELTKSHTKNNFPENLDRESKNMINSTEFESLADFLNTAGGGYVILHKERAPTRDDHSGASIASSKLSERFGHFLGNLESSLGAPIKTATEWDLGIPTFASGNGYALWSIGESFVSLFVSWDNPEDPAFIILGRAPLSILDTTPGAPNPWKSGWMHKGQW